MSYPFSFGKDLECVFADGLSDDFAKQAKRRVHVVIGFYQDYYTLAILSCSADYEADDFSYDN